jgi:hypothetical protein
MIIFEPSKSKKDCPTNRHADAKGERRYSSFSFLTSALDGGEWSASFHGRTLLSGEDPWYPLIRGLDTEAREKILCLCRGLNHVRSVCSQTLYWLRYPSSEYLDLRDSRWHKDEAKYIMMSFISGTRLVCSSSGDITGQLPADTEGNRLSLNAVWVSVKRYRPAYRVFCAFYIKCINLTHNLEVGTSPVAQVFNPSNYLSYWNTSCISLCTPTLRRRLRKFRIGQQIRLKFATVVKIILIGLI